MGASYNSVGRKHPRNGEDTRRKDLEPENLAKTVVEMVVGKLGEDVLLLDIRDVSTFADYFVICHGTSDRQLQAIQEEVTARLQEMGSRPLHVEGTPSSGWILLDYGSVVLHVFLPVTRQYYNLEQLWKEAKTILRIQ
jgi:ribosome-associated protein